MGGTFLRSTPTTYVRIEPLSFSAQTKPERRETETAPNREEATLGGHRHGRLRQNYDGGDGTTVAYAPDRDETNRRESEQAKCYCCYGRNKREFDLRKSARKDKNSNLLYALKIARFMVAPKRKNSHFDDVYNTSGRERRLTRK